MPPEASAPQEVPVSTAGTGKSDPPPRLRAGAYATDTPARQGRPKPVDADYRTRRMIHLTITTQEMRMLGLSSGSGSVSLAFAGYFAKIAAEKDWPADIVLATIGFAAVTIFVYAMFFGLVKSIRRQSDLKGLGIFGD